MAHRTVIDLFLGRHYCPACGKAAGFRHDRSYDRTSVRWYQLARVRVFCNACGVEVQGTLRRGVWAVLPVWILLGGCALVVMMQTRFITSNSALLGIFTVWFLVGLCTVQAFLHYDIARHAP
jgi:hypothetical protein